MDYKLKEDIQTFKNIKEMTNDDLASFFGTSTMNIWRWMNDKVTPNNSTLKMIYNKIYSSGVDLNKLKEDIYKSKENSKIKIVFHGSKSGIIGNISTKYGDIKKDFGQAFYTGENIEQAISFVSAHNDSSLYILEVDISKLKVKTFEVSKEWMLYIAYSRGKLEEYKDSKYIQDIVSELNGYDIVIAPIADNTMYDILNDFTDGLITDEQCLHSLSANRLGKQIVFLNEKSVKHLKILEHCFVSEKEKEYYLEIRKRSMVIGKQKAVLERRKYSAKGKYIEEFFL